MKKLLLALLLAVMTATPAFAQSGTGVRQSGNVTPGHVPVWTTNGVIQDGGTAAQGFLTSLGVTNNSGPGICINSAPITAPYNRLCLSVSTSAAANISLQNLGGAAAQAFNITINGITYPFPGTGTGNVLGPISSTVGNLAVWGDTLGTLLSDGGPLNYISAKREGAVGNGTTDDTVALQAWATACQNSNSVCYLDPTPGSCYKTSAVINFTNVASIIGGGRGVTAICPSNTTQDTLSIVTSRDLGIVSGFTIVPSVTKTGGSGISLTSSTTFNSLWTFRDLRIALDFNGISVANAGGGGPVFDNVDIVCSNKCINGDDGNTLDIAMEDAAISNSYIQPVGVNAVGIYLFSVSGLKISNTKINGAGNYGVQIAIGSACTTCADFIWTGGSIEGVDKGIVFSGAGPSFANFIVSGTEFAVTTVGIEIGGTGLNNVAITGSVITTNTGFGISVDNGTNVDKLYIGGNVITSVLGAGTTGISIGTGTTNCTLGLNRISGWTTPIVDATSACVQATSRVAALTSNALILGGGLSALSPLGSLGTTTTVLHGNAAGAPTFGPVALTTDITGVLPVANGGTNCSSPSGTCLDNITSFSGTGLLARTGPGGYSGRTITGTSNRLTVTNGDGIAGNPTLDISAAYLANPTGTVGLTAVNGTATTAMRSDGAPALSQAIIPTWTGAHTFNGSSTTFNPSTGAGGVAINGPAAQNLTLDVFSVSGQSSFLRLGSSAGGQFEFQVDSAGNWVANVAGVANGAFQVLRSGAAANTLILSSGNVRAASGNDASSTSTGALQVTGGASINKRVFMNGITTSAGLQTAVLCQSSGGEVIADSVACLASSGKFKDIIGTLSDDEVAKLTSQFEVKEWRYKREPDSVFPDSYYNPRIGLIAEDVEKVDHRLVEYDRDGVVRTIDYNAIISLLGRRLQALEQRIR